VAAYRTTRIILIAKTLIGPGKGLFEGLQERMEGDIFTHREPIRSGSSLEAIREEAGALPTLIADDITDDEIVRLSAVHMYAAIQAGYDPSNKCLHWFRPDMIEEFLPNMDHLLAFESALLRDCGDLLIKKSRATAYDRIREHLGDPGVIERRDWTSLPMASVRDFEALTTEDDRALMVARLEHLTQEAIEQLDLGKALQAQRALSQVQSLTFQDTERAQREFAILFNQQNERSDELAISRDSPVLRRLQAE